MNILILSWRDIKHPSAGGAEQVMHEHAKGWVRAGHKVTHFSSKTKRLVKLEKIDGVDFVRSGYQYLGVQIAGFLYYLRNKQRIDLIVDEFHGIPFFTPLYINKPKLAVIQEVARKVWFLNPLPWPMNWIVGLVGYITEPLVFIFYKKTAFMTGSESAKRDVSKFGVPIKKITVVPHGVILPQKLKILKKEKTKTITFLGILSKDKGIEDAISAFSIINNVGDYQFWVVGRPETISYGKKIKSMVKGFGLNGRIKFWGYVNQSQKFKLLSMSHVLINPSVHEGWGLVNIEANSVGTPTVSYNSAGLIDSVKDGVSGLICQNNTIKDLAENIISLLNDPAKYKKLSRGAISWSQKFDWQKSRKLSLKLINEIALDSR